MSVVLVEKPSDGVTLLRLNRPEVKNALNVEVRQLVAENLNALATDPACRVVIITGNHEAFAAGADIGDMATASSVDMMLRGLNVMWKAIMAFPKPVIAAVNGFALGGGSELAMNCDIIVAGEGARFGLPEVRIGIIPGAGGTQRLTRAVGKYQAMKMLLTGSMVSAEEALRMGLASEVVPDAECVPRAIKLAETIAGMPPLAVAAIKEVVNAGMDNSLDTALLLERKAMHLLFSTRDQKEGMGAFLEKRKPKYEGR